MYVRFIESRNQQEIGNSSNSTLLPYTPVGLFMVFMSTAVAGVGPESWKPIYFGVQRSGVTKNNAGV